MQPMQSPYPMHHAPQFQAAPPFGQRPNASGHPVGAVFLAFFVSVIVSMLYSGLILATYKDLSLTTANTLYLGHALINGAIVGFLIGTVAHRNNGAWISGAIIAALGAFFGYTNAIPLVFADADSPSAVWDMVRYEPFWPAKAWWTDESADAVDWFSPLGLVLAAAAAWGLAYLVGSRRRQA
ncbi:hypothetical protein [Streptomyces sp. NBC_00299]|uniref:hypothetical protein n=1 Tax=Streptomyces sp. NBC_00299 TaxID=2975705 RepID=UPI002E289934|nr:hypothetical protein [Streptomyces sp. NBC_00299]